jgi:hypothetical protein
VKEESLPMLLILLAGLAVFALLLAGAVTVVVLLVRSQRRSRQSNSTP